MPTVIDISLPIGKDLLTWPGDPPLQILPHKRISEGDSANVSELRLGSHTGTHIDPPVHFIEGAEGTDRVPLASLMGPALVVDVRGRPDAIGSDELESLGIPEDTERLLLRSDSSELWRSLPAAFPSGYVHLTPEGAAWIVRHGIRLVGVDFLSIEARGSEGHPTHVELLSNGVVIVEGLNLGDVEPGAYTLVCLPLRVVDGDGGPARAVLMREDRA
jgi:arylformamidase